MSSCSPAAIVESAPTSSKQLLRRRDCDDSQKLRLSIQLAFLLLNICIGIQFYFWVRWAETSGLARFVNRPAGVEGWLPIEALMQLKYVLVAHRWPAIHPAGLFLFLAFLLISFLLRKAFCSWLCPLGTVSEYLWKLGRYTFRRNFRLPPWLDIALRGTKYLLLGFFGYAVAMMSATAIASFLSEPYALIVDVRMLNFFRYLGEVAAFTLLGLIVASIFVQNFWCRYLCPYGALLGLVALLSPLRIRRNQNTCIDCAKCSKACPSALPVDKLVQIRSAECTGCLECVAVCPAKDALAISAVLPPVARHPIRGKAVSAWTIAAAIALLFFGVTSYAKLTGHWNTQLPQQLYFELVTNASNAQHP